MLWQFTTLPYLSPPAGSAKGERLGPSQIFPSNMHILAHGCGFPATQEYVRAF